MKADTFSAFPEETLQFLRKLKRNNNREWFQEHKAAYEEFLKQPMTELIQALGKDFKKFAPEMIASPQVSAFRIYRDTRFSQDKSPYKTHIAAVFPRAGLGKHEGARFYLHIAPSDVFVGGGLYMPPPEDLHAVRMHIAKRSAAFFRILRSSEFRKHFGEISGERLSRVPKGFPADHSAAEYLKHKQFLAARTLPASVATSPAFYKMVLKTFRAMLPLVRFLNDPIVEARRMRDRQKALTAL